MTERAWQPTPIAIVHSPFRERFGIPRQAGLAPAAVGRIEMLPPWADPAAFDGLDGFSHIWVCYRFHALSGADWRPRVRPPRLGGNRSIGVFASRSPYRPNRLGLSALRLLDVDCRDGVSLRVGGLDLLDGTPVYDIRPYVPYADRLDDAVGGFASAPPGAVLEVHFSPPARRQLAQCADAAQFERLICEVLALDPRPAYQNGDAGERVYGTRLGDADVRWRVTEGRAEVLEILIP